MPRSSSDNENEDRGPSAQDWREMQKQMHALQRENRGLKQRFVDRTNQMAVDDDDDDNPAPSHRRKRKTHELAEDSDREDDDDSRAATDRLKRPVRKRGRPTARHDEPAPASARATTPEQENEGREPTATPAPAPSPSPPLASRPVPDPETIIEWGKKFVFNYSPWIIHPSVFSLPLKPGVGDKPATRFIKVAKRFLVENLKQGQLRDLLELIPPEFHWLRKNKDFCKHFEFGMQQMRQAWSRRLRAEGVHQIFGARADHMDASHDRFENFADFIGYVPATGRKAAGYSALCAPVLHSRALTDKSFKKTDVFTRKELKTTWIGLLRGGPAAEAFRTQGVSSSPSPTVYQSKFEIRTAMRAHLATAGIMTRWALSGDTELRPEGDQTNIDWLEDFHDYLAVIHRAVEVGDASMRRVFREWDTQVFNSVHSPYGGDGDLPSVLRAEELEDALAQYDDPTVEQNEDAQPGENEQES